MNGRKSLTDSEFNNLFTYLRSSKQPLEVIFDLLLSTGMRQCELMSCKLDESLNQIYVKSSKGSFKRRIPLDPDLVKKLRLLEWPLYRNFSSTSASQSITRMLRRYWDKILFKAIGSDPVTLHGLRHTFAVRLLDEVDKDVRIVQRLMGHKSVNSTIRYLECIEMEQMDSAVLNAVRKKA